ncbi:hypothetical protein FB45DRAFT_872762 [Roridomyces roridus]|uniref:Uncharacterized protein n=1 Tax=Roridomyces roridus TaxID=1738132 RepID=A0AAD7BD31_9AGAR|nr:hypothetical protein FB45DRAFT_872762 [Roridomyces roridus]
MWVITAQLSSELSTVKVRSRRRIWVVKPLEGRWSRTPGGQLGSNSCRTGDENASTRVVHVDVAVGRTQFDVRPQAASFQWTTKEGGSRMAGPISIGKSAVGPAADANQVDMMDLGYDGDARAARPVHRIEYDEQDKSEVEAALEWIIMVLRIYRLWDHRIDVVRNLTAMFAVFISATIILGVFVVKTLQPTYAQALRTCVLSTKPLILEVAEKMTQPIPYDQIN